MTKLSSFSNVFQKRSRLARKKVCTCHLGQDFPPGDFSTMKLDHQLSGDQHQLPGDQHQHQLQGDGFSAPCMLPQTSPGAEWPSLPPPYPPPREAPRGQECFPPRETRSQEQAGDPQEDQELHWFGIEQLLFDTCKRWFKLFNNMENPP